MDKEVKYIRKVGDRAFLFETYEQPLRTQIKELKQQLKEKDKEIEKLKITKNNAIECADLFKVALSVRQKDFAIQELEKVKTLIQNAINFERPNFVEVYDALNKQIKELRRE